MSGREGPWLAGGKHAWELLTPDPAMVDWEDIALRLSRMPRFGGTGRKFYSVAQHSILVADLVVRAGHKHLAGHGLLHDAHEALLGDWVTPVKRALDDLAGGECWALAELERRTATVLHRAAGLEFPLRGADADTLKHFDMVALATEKRDLQIPEPRPWPPMPPPDEIGLGLRCVANAKTFWLEGVNELRKAKGARA